MFTVALLVSVVVSFASGSLTHSISQTFSSIVQELNQIDSSAKVKKEYSSMPWE